MTDGLHPDRSPGQMIRQLAALYRLTEAHFIQLAKDHTDQRSRAYYLRARYCTAVVMYLEKILREPADHTGVSQREVRLLLRRLKRIHRIQH